MTDPGDLVDPQKDATKMRAIYFGCQGGPGYYFFHEHGAAARSVRPKECPWERIDGKLTPTETKKQSTAALHRMGGWTALALHDYTLDKRPGSNVVFLFDADLDSAEAMAAAQRYWPKEFARLGEIEIVEMRTTVDP